MRALIVLALALYSSACRGGGAPLPPPPLPAVAVEREPDGRVVFELRPPAGAPPVISVTVRGGFNDWAEHALPMSRQPDGSWRVVGSLEPGTHQYKFFINGGWPSDMCNDAVWGDPLNRFWIDAGAEGCVPDGHTGRNAVVTVRDAPHADGSGFQHDPVNASYVSVAGGRISIRFRAGRGDILSARIITGPSSIPMHRQLAHGSVEMWRATLPTGTASYSFSLETRDGAGEHGPFTMPADPFSEVPWVAGAVGYQIFPERFNNGDPDNDHLTLASSARRHTHPALWTEPEAPVLMKEWGGEVRDFHCCHQYFGGDLKGVLDRLPYLASIGVTLIYLNPIFVAGSAHGYDTFDHMSVSPSLGDERLLRTLLDSAHDLGMRVMWDFVPNHVGVGHWAFRHALAHGEASPYWSWFRFRVPASMVEAGNAAHYGAWSGFGSLPELDTRTPAVLDHLLRVTRHWTEFGFDGIRVDVPGDIQNRQEFFSAFRRAAKSVDPDVYLVGEIWGRSPGWLKGNEFDALMNYALGRDVVQRFAAGEIAASAAADAMAQLYEAYPEATVAMSFNLISSHDTPRVLTSMGGGELGQRAQSGAIARQRLASALLFALPGMPVTFQGDECAFLGGGPPREENRYPMQWDACDADMVAHYRRLAELKSESNALRSPVIRLPRGSSSLLSFHRGEPGSGEMLLVFNGASEGAALGLPAGQWMDANSGAELEGEIDLPGFGWRYLRRR